MVNDKNDRLGLLLDQPRNTFLYQSALGKQFLCCLHLDIVEIRHSGCRIDLYASRRIDPNNIQHKEDVSLAKKGQKYKCGQCGVVVMVDEACGCTPCDLVCCGQPMKETKAPPVVGKKKVA